MSPDKEREFYFRDRQTEGAGYQVNKISES